VAEASVCLMDEPLSNLDAKLRQEMRREIRSLQLSLGITMVYVTHDQTEAMSMADRIILMQGGRIVQNGTPAELYSRPANLFAAGFIGTPPMNLVRLAPGAQSATVMGCPEAKAPGAPSGECMLGVRPEHLRIGPEGDWPAVVESVEYLGVSSVVACRVGEELVSVSVDGLCEFSPGANVRLGFPPSKAHFFDRATGLSVSAA
jgi:sn-glycerol 3-phosphate transport system ATP-binding protein